MNKRFAQNPKLHTVSRGSRLSRMLLASMRRCFLKANQQELNMQQAKHNRATIRVADRTEVSGRVTAHEVNLDRFHHRIRKVCALAAARSKVHFSAATMILIVTLAVPAVAQVTFAGAIQGHERGVVKGTTQSSFGTVTGIVSNLGQLSLTYENTINLISGDGTGFGVLLIAQNGDSIFANIIGKFTPPPPGSTLTVPSVTEYYTITGGTGRFKRVAGKFTVERLIDFADVEMDFAFTGGAILGGTITF
jgi:hypothetical protein